MKTISQIIAGAQALFNISFNLTGCFEEYLSDEYKTFLQMLRVIEEQLPTLTRPYAGTGRIPYQYTPFIRSFLAKGYFGIEKTGRLIRRLKGEPNLRLLCGFTGVPGKATFFRVPAFLPEQGILEQTPDGMVSMAHKGRVVYHVNRDSTAIEAREKVVKKRGGKAAETGKKAGEAGKRRAESPQRAGSHRKADHAGRENIAGGTQQGMCMGVQEKQWGECISLERVQTSP
jgi:hypothetical protein